MEEQKIYKLIYSVDKRGPVCIMHTYSVTEKTDYSYTYTDGSRPCKISNDAIGVITAARIDETTLCVYLASLKYAQAYVKEMARMVKETAERKNKRYEHIAANAIECSIVAAQP